MTTADLCFWSIRRARSFASEPTHLLRVRQRLLSDLLEPEENPVTDEQPDSVETADLSEQEEAKTTSENTGVKETEAGTDELHGENAPNVADEESEEDSIIDVAEPAENKVKTNQDTLNSVRAQQQTEPQ